MNMNCLKIFQDNQVVNMAINMMTYFFDPNDPHIIKAIIMQYFDNDHVENIASSMLTYISDTREPLLNKA